MNTFGLPTLTTCQKCAGQSLRLWGKGWKTLTAIMECLRKKKTQRSLAGIAKVHIYVTQWMLLAGNAMHLMIKKDVQSLGSPPESRSKGWIKEK